MLDGAGAPGHAGAAADMKQQKRRKENGEWKDLTAQPAVNSCESPSANDNETHTQGRGLGEVGRSFHDREKSHMIDSTSASA